MIERRVEHALLLFRGEGTDPDPLQQVFPFRDETLPYAVEVPIREILFGVGFRLFGTEERDADFQEHLGAAFPESEVDLAVQLPAVRDRRVGNDMEINGVGSAAAPASARGGEAADLVAGNDRDGTVQVGLAAPVPMRQDEAGIDFQAPSFAFRVPDAVERGAFGGSDLDPDAGALQEGGVVSDPDVFFPAQCRMLKHIHPFGEWHDQDIAIFGGASGTADVQLAESLDGHFDGPPAGIAALDVRGGFDHSEGTARAHDDMSAPSGPDGRIDVTGQVALLRAGCQAEDQYGG